MTYIYDDIEEDEEEVLFDNADTSDVGEEIALEKNMLALT